MLGLAASGCQEARDSASRSEVGGLAQGEYRKVLADYGGAYADPKLSAWVTLVGQALARRCGRPDIAFSFTVVDSGLVNAFSTPGGYVYLTRGLLALANSEAEVAAVLGHEMGHVIAGHQVERYRRSQSAGIGSLLLGAVSGSSALAELAESGAVREQAGFSREQEYEADALGIRIMAEAGYDPDAMTRLLDALDRDATLYRRIGGDVEPDRSRIGYVEDHPLTEERIARAHGVIAATPRSNRAKIGRDAYLRAVDGMLYGSKTDQGYLRGRLFIQPSAGFRLELPAGFAIENSDSAVIATRADGAAVILTSASPGPAASPFDYLQRVWAGGIALSAVDSISLNGHPAATGVAGVDSDRGPVGVRLVAIGWSPSLVYRLVLISPSSGDPGAKPDLDRVVDSFRPLSQGELRRLPPTRIRVLTARPRDTVAGLARLMAFDDFGEERLRAINALGDGQQIAPGDQLKLVE